MKRMLVHGVLVLSAAVNAVLVGGLVAVASSERAAERIAPFVGLASEGQVELARAEEGAC